MLKCSVKGCHSFYALGAEAVHDQLYQESHQVLLKNEVERLKGALFNKVDELNSVVYDILVNFEIYCNNYQNSDSDYYSSVVGHVNGNQLILHYFKR